jgi:DnaJ-class molecular chaperone
MACASCRGHGWKFRRSRRALVIGTLIRAAAEAVRQSCLDCGGSGRVRELA